MYGAGNRSAAEARGNTWHRDASVPPKPEAGAGSLQEMEVCGTDTPPEKVPRQILQSKEDASSSSVFASIMHKFVRVDGGGRPSDG